MANSVSHASLPYPIKNARYTIPVPYLDADGDPTDPTTPDTEVSIDAAAFADCAEEVTTISGANGSGYITLSGAETNGSLIVVCAKVASGPKATLLTLTPRALATVGSGTLSAGSAGGGTLGTILAYDVTGCFIRTTGGTGGGGTGGANNQARIIATYTTSSGVFTVVPNWETTPDNTTTYDVLLPEGVTLGMLRALNPTTAGRTLDVSTGGEAGLDWANIGSPTTTVGLSGTTVKTATDVETDTADIQSRIPAALVSGRIDASVGAMAANTVTASALATDAVAEIADGVFDEALSGHTTAGTFGAVFAAGVIDSGTAQAGGASTVTLRAGAPSTNLAAGGGAIVRLLTGTGAGQQGWISAYDTGTKVATIRGTWLTNPDNTTTYDVVHFPASTRIDVGTIKDQTVTCAAGVTVLASVGTAATSTAQTGDAFARIGANGAGLTALGDTRIANLDATITSRMATYTQPTGFLAATFPTTVASTTNITAGTITTVTTLTNDPTGVTTLLTRLSGTRAGYLDNLSAGAVALEATAQAILADTGTDGVVVASGSKTGYSLAAAGLDSIVIETGVNARQSLSAIMSSTAGVLSGAGTGTVVIKGGNVATTRITATTDSNGNRSAITLSLPS